MAAVMRATMHHPMKMAANGSDTHSDDILAFYLFTQRRRKRRYRRISVYPLLQYWRAFLETPETFRAHFGCHNFLRIFKMKTFPGMNFCKKFTLSYLQIIVKDQRFRISGRSFKNGFSDPKRLRDFRETGPRSAKR